FRERVTEWENPKIPYSLATVLVFAVLGVFYLGIFSDGVIRLFKSSPSAFQLRVSEPSVQPSIDMTKAER
ncbi:MAG: hypothetical protein ACK419_04125, partial [Pyrinomonadaceae bacterium]